MPDKGTVSVSQVANGAVSVFATISHPLLRNMDTMLVAKFVRERERYKQQFNEKEASYKVSVVSGLLDALTYADEFSEIAPNAKKPKYLTSEQIKMFK